MPTVDKSTLFRTLNLLSDLHAPQSKIKHIHFNCRICHQTVCLTDVSLPEVTLPDGYTVEDTEYVVKGVCPKCAGK